MLDRHKEIYGHYPLKAALDGGFTSKVNLASAKGRGIKDVCFAKKRVLEKEEMCRSTWVNDFADSVLVLNPGSHSSSDALGLPDECGNHCHRFTVMYGHQLSQPTF